MDMPLWDLLWTMVWLALFVIWIWLVITIFIDLLHADMSGWAKAAWVVFVIVLPILGVLVYLIVHGGDMQRRKMRQIAEEQEAQQQHIQSVAGSSSADQLEKLKSLHDQGVLTDSEYAAQKAKVLDA